MTDDWQAKHQRLRGEIREILGTPDAMTSLPKRGDRVRVTETLYQPSLLGSELELTHDAHWYDDSQTWMRFRCEQAGYVGPVKVEILERAGASLPDHVYSNPPRDESERARWDRDFLDLLKAIDEARK